jgi:hypothetical protein
MFLVHEFMILFLPMASAKYTNRWLYNFVDSAIGFQWIFCVFKLKSEDLSQLETYHVP